MVCGKTLQMINKIWLLFIRLNAYWRTKCAYSSKYSPETAKKRGRVYQFCAILPRGSRVNARGPAFRHPNLGMSELSTLRWYPSPCQPYLYISGIVEGSISSNLPSMLGLKMVLCFCQFPFPPSTCTYKPAKQLHAISHYYISRHTLVMAREGEWSRVFANSPRGQ